MDVDGNINLSADLSQVDWLGLKVGSHPVLTLHTSNEPGELSQWLWSIGHEDSTKNIAALLLLLLLTTTKQIEPQSASFLSAL